MDLINLSLADLTGLAAIAFVAGIIRGFTGFALSAFALAVGVLILPPVELIPVLWWLEIAASLSVLKSMWQEADRTAAFILAAGSAVGVYFGLGLTVALDPDASRQIALVILISLAALQLTRVRIPGLATTTGTTATGLVAGTVTGLSGVGGMVVALYVLARDTEPKLMRATLMLFLLAGSVTSFLTHLWYGTMNATSTTRGLVLIPACVLGVILGARLFTPRWQPYYRPACLTLLIGLGLVSFVRGAL